MLWLFLISSLASAQTLEEWGALDERWNRQEDVEAGEKLISIASGPNGTSRSTALIHLCHMTPDYKYTRTLPTYYPRLKALAEELGKDPDMFVRQSAERLAQCLDYHNYHSPDALAKKAARQARETQRAAAPPEAVPPGPGMMRAILELTRQSPSPETPQPLLECVMILGGSLAVAAFILLLQNFGIGLLFGSAGGLPAAIPAFRKLVGSSPGFLLLPPFCAGFITLVLLAVITNALDTAIPPGAADNDGLMSFYIVRALVNWPAVLAYFAAGAAVTLLQAAIVHGVVTTAREGRAPSVSESAAAVFVRLRPVVVLSMLVYGLLWVLHVGMLKLRNKLPAFVRELMELAAWLLGVAASFGSAVVAGRIVCDGQSLEEALAAAHKDFAETREQELKRLAALAILHAGTVNYVALIPLAGGQICGFNLMVSYLPPTPLTGVQCMGLGLAAGAGVAALIYSVLLTVQAVVAAEVILPAPAAAPLAPKVDAA